MPSELSIIINSIQNSHAYFAWANSASDRKSGSIVFSGNEFAKGTPVVVKFTDAVCNGFSFSFNKNHSEGIIFSLQLSVPKVEYTDRVES